MLPEELWKFWDSPEGSWEIHNILGLKKYIEEYPLCEFYIDKISKIFDVFYDEKISCDGTCDLTKKIILINPKSTEQIIKTLIHEIYHLVYNIGKEYKITSYFKGFEELIEEEVEKLYSGKKELVLYIQEVFGIPLGRIYENPNQLKL